ncbi:MAG: hypothetical protein HUU20_05365 [Pirellulales bacterium]|nr:hypothetical protein [Pirellulales bacterium]
MQSAEVDFDAYHGGYRGTLAGYDFYYYFERDEYGRCWFKLRSDSLGYPEGYEQAWEIGSDDSYTGGRGDLTCKSLSTCVEAPALYSESGGDADNCTGGQFCTECVEWITPMECDTCQCLCECICITMRIGADICFGKACWDEYEQAYVGEVACVNSEYDFGGAPYRTVPVTFPIRAYGEVCDGESDCDPYDTRCVIGIGVDGEDPSNWQFMSNCEWRAVNYSWEFYADYTDAVVFIRCARCYEDCQSILLRCCDEELPTTLFASFAEWRVPGFGETCEARTDRVSLHWTAFDSTAGLPAWYTAEPTNPNSKYYMFVSGWFQLDGMSEQLRIYAVPCPTNSLHVTPGCDITKVPWVYGLISDNPNTLCLLHGGSCEDSCSPVFLEFAMGCRCFLANAGLTITITE